MILPDWLFQGPFDKIQRITYNLKPLKQTARGNIELDEKRLDEDWV